ncbi:hypothetical protein FG99_28270 [Pseudomonas sp. AAC]|nr:hypothetical protein FG99_28270 [Pseudomonas sp. AAC]
MMPAAPSGRRLHLPGQARAERQVVRQHLLRRLGLRVVADAVEHHRVRPRDQLAVALDHVRAGDRVHGPVDQPQWHGRALHGAHPALAVFAAVEDVVDQPVHHLRPVVAGDQAPERVQLLLARPGARAEHLGEVGGQLATVEEAPEEAAQRAEQQLLREHRAVRLGEQPAIEEHQRGQLDLSFQVPRQQFLADAVAVVVDQQVHGLAHRQMLQQRLLQVGLLMDAVGVVARLGRIAEAEHVAGDHPVAPGQRLPQLVPVPGGAGEAVDQQQRLARAGLPVADGVAVEVEGAPLRAPVAQGDGDAGHQSR